MITNHQYLAYYPIDRNATRLILGTIHPHDHAAFQLPYFYGNEMSIWKIFHKAFPDELVDPSDLDSVISFLKNRRLAVSDTIISCKRLHPTALDKDLLVIKDNADVLLDALRNSHIKEVLCTSGFGKNNAFKLFYERILKQKITPEIRHARKVSIILPESDKMIKIFALYSPARTANRGIARSIGYQTVKDTMTVNEYRINLYAKAIENT